MQNDPATSMNLNKVISSTGMCSRRAADKMIADGRVTTFNGPQAETIP